MKIDTVQQNKDASRAQNFTKYLYSQPSISFPQMSNPTCSHKICSLMNRTCFNKYPLFYYRGKSLCFIIVSVYLLNYIFVTIFRAIKCQ